MTPQRQNGVDGDVQDDVGSDVYEDDRLVDLAGAVSDRRDVDWRQATAEGLGPGVDGLRTLARLAAAFDADTATGTGHDVDSPPPLFRWGHLEVLELVGSGQFGEVYRAHDPQLGRDVALKLGPRAADELPRRSLAEARRLARVRHPNVLTVHGAAVHDGRAGIWTDLLAGETLEETLEARRERDRRLGADELAAIGTELCRALAAVHGAGVVHGDVKTSNVLRDADGRLVLVDFGAAHLPRDGAPAIVQATPAYLAPEVARGEASPTAGSDLYALGALLYRLATGEFRHGEGAQPLRDARPDLPTPLVAAIESLLAERPEDRPASAGEAERLLARRSDAERSVGGKTLLGKTVLGKTVLAALATALLLLVALAATLLRQPSAPTEPTEPTEPPTVPHTTRSATLSAERDGEVFDVDPGATLRPGDRLSLQVEVDADTHVYVFNEDDEGELFVLFPLPGVEPRNPLPAGSHRLPGAIDGRPQSWQVTSAGGRERFLIVGASRALPELESFGDGQDVASAERAVRAGSRPSEDDVLRGVGGLAPGPEGDEGSVLASLRERLAGEGDGVWTRLWTFDNPR